jgi:hypothetical protein
MEERREKSVEVENLGEVGRSVGDDAVTGPVTRHTSWVRRTISDSPAPTQHNTPTPRLDLVIAINNQTITISIPI